MSGLINQKPLYISCVKYKTPLILTSISMVVGVALILDNITFSILPNEFGFIGLSFCAASFFCLFILICKICCEMKIQKQNMKKKMAATKIQRWLRKTHKIRKEAKIRRELNIKKEIAATKIQKWFRKTYDQNTLFHAYQNRYRNNKTKTTPLTIYQIKSLEKLQELFSNLHVWERETRAMQLEAFKMPVGPEQYRKMALLNDRLSIIINILGAFSEAESREMLLKKHRITLAIGSDNCIQGVCFSTIRAGGSEIHIDYLLSVAHLVEGVGASLIIDNIFFSIKHRKSLSSSDSLPPGRTTISLVPLKTYPYLKDEYYMGILHFKERTKMVTIKDFRRGGEQRIVPFVDLILRGEDLRYALRTRGGRCPPSHASI